MLPKNLRLSSNKIKEVIEKGSYRNFDGFYVKTIFSESLAYPQFAIVISKKINKKSTKRNRLKRIIRHFLINNFNYFKKGLYVIVVTKNDENLLKHNLKRTLLSFE